jgi:outer membrane biosynthesis protein TonB
VALGVYGIEMNRALIALCLWTLSCSPAPTASGPAAEGGKKTAGGEKPPPADAVADGDKLASPLPPPKPIADEKEPIPEGKQPISEDKPRDPAKTKESPQAAVIGGPGQAGGDGGAPPPAAATAHSLSGRISEAEVGQVVNAGISAFGPCSRLDATVTVNLQIDAEGRVGDASAARSDPDDAKMRDCVVRAFKTLRFPKSADGRSSPVRFELRLTPKP